MKFDELARELNASMMRDYECVDMKRNPVYANRGQLRTNQLEYALGQYTLFPKNIVSFLYSARDGARQAGWKKVDIELTRNMGQELGTETHGVSHYNLLVENLKRGGLLKKGKIKPSVGTQKFLKNMQCISGENVIPYACGGVYAMESSARPELKIVLGLVEDLNKYRNSPKELDDNLKQFFDMHIRDWEPGHERGLKEALAESIVPIWEGDFRKGFHDVMGAMDAWWYSLYYKSRVVKDDTRPGK